MPGYDEAVDLMTVVEGEFWLTRGIYKVENDVLTICEGGRDEERPTEFRLWEPIDHRFTLLRRFKGQMKGEPPENRALSSEGQPMGPSR